MVALVAYYAVVIVVVGPMYLAQAGADSGARIPVRLALNVAMHTKKTNVATFTTPFPITVGVASDGSFTIPRGDLNFALVDVPVDTATPALGWLTVRAAAMSDFLGTVNTSTGEATLDGSLELLWSTRTQTPAPGFIPMLECPVGPIALHLSSATLGGTQLAPQSLRYPTSRTARLVDDNLDVRAVPPGMKQCAGNESGLNVALSLPILPTVEPTTTTVAGSSTTATTATTTTTSTTTPPSTESTTTTTIVGGTPPGPPTDALGIALDPKVLALEPSPSIVSTLTIATVPPPVVGSPATPATGSFVAPASLTPSVGGAPLPATTPARPRTAKVAKQSRNRHHANKHAQTDAATTTSHAGTNVAPPLYFSPMNFAPRVAPHNSLLAPGPLLNLGESAFARHRTGLSILFVVFLVVPLAAFGLGLVASDFGWRPGRRGGQGHGANATRKLAP